MSVIHNNGWQSQHDLSLTSTIFWLMTSLDTTNTGTHNSSGFDLASGSDFASGMGNQKRPNILIIKCDQLSSWGLSCYGGTEVHTPHIDRLAAEGAQLQQYFTNVALCTPSRACFMTGRYPNQSGIYAGDHGLGLDQRTIAHQLRDAGYQTGYSGKWHLSSQQLQSDNNWAMTPNYGWDDNRYMWNKGHFNISHTMNPGNQDSTLRLNVALLVMRKRIALIG